MRKFVSVFLSIILCLTLVGCVGKKDKDKPLRVCFVYSGLLGDKSYNDACDMGAKRAVKEFNIELKSLEGHYEDEWEKNFVEACNGGYDLIIASSSNLAKIVETYAPKYPKTKFAILDTSMNIPNVTCISFAQNQSSFLAGAAAAMFTTKDDIPGVNKEKIIGWVGGMDIPVLHDFFVGYEQGAKFIDPQMKVLQSFAGSWQDPDTGKKLAMEQYAQGADIVMNVAGRTGEGIMRAAKETGRYAIGVDLNQDNEVPGQVLTSALKRVDNATYYIIKSVVKGDFKGGQVQYLTLKEGGVGLTDFSVIKKALGNNFPQDIIEKCDDIERKIISGDLVVDNYPGFGPEAAEEQHQ